MIITYSQKFCTGKYSQCSSIIWSVWLNNWVFVDKLRVFVFESCCCHLNFRCRVCFQQGVSWHSGNYRASIYSGTRTWYDNNIQSCYHFHTLRRKGEIKTVSFLTRFHSSLVQWHSLNWINDWQGKYIWSRLLGWLYAKLGRWIIAAGIVSGDCKDEFVKK